MTSAEGLSDDEADGFFHRHIVRPGALFAVQVGQRLKP